MGAILAVPAAILVGSAAGVASEYRCKTSSMPRYKLLDANGKAIDNTRYECIEQELLSRYLKDGDRVLQLGGNVGTSCITASKAKKLACNVCVEPNSKILPMLKHNVKNTGIRVVEGVISDTSDHYLNAGADSLAARTEVCRGARCRKTRRHVKSFPLSSVEPPGKFNVLFMDCEGCAPLFIQEYGAELAKTLRLVILERDVAHAVDYKPVDAFLRHNDFKLKDRRGVLVFGIGLIWEVYVKQSRQRH